MDQGQGVMVVVVVVMLLCGVCGERKMVKRIQRAADHHIQVPLAAGNDVRGRRRHLGACAKSQGLSRGSPRPAEERRHFVDVAVDAGDVGVEFRRQ